MTHLYLDNNASTPLDDEVYKAMQQCLAFYGNPHAGHFLGGLAREAISKARESVLSVFALDKSKWTCIFTSGATESINMAIKGFIFNRIRTQKNSPSQIKIVSSQVEHSSVDKSLQYMEELLGGDKVNVSYLPVDEHGIVNLEAFDLMIDQVDLMTCIHTVAETGAVQPIAEISSWCKSKFPDSLFHCDASQSVGKLSESILHSLGQHVDMITVAGHKFGGPKYIGALIVRNSVLPKLDPIIHGAGQEFGMRGGTENAMSIVGLGRACELASSYGKHNEDMAAILWDAIRQEFDLRGNVSYRLNSTAPVRSRYTVNFSVAGLNGPALVSTLGNDNHYGIKICFSAGSACHSRGGPTPSKVLAAMGLEPKFSTSGIRLSVGKSTRIEDLRKAGQLIARHISETI
jgi:cysteine desulfurase